MALNTEAVGKPLGPVEREYSWKDVVLYALGVGAGFDELHYVYENQLKVIPTFSIAAVIEFLAQATVESGADLSGILHGEQEIIFHQAIPTEGTLKTSGTITRMYDRGKLKGALVVAEADTYHSDGQKLFTNVFTLFCRKDGGFGGEPPPQSDFAFPEREPDFSVKAQPSADQPLLYRLSGDLFVLHVDPEFAQSVGFERPIMHGLCTYGYACRACIASLVPGQPERVSRFKARFSRPLYPGHPIRTEIWKLQEGRALFRVLNDETGEVVLDRGEIEWLDDEGLARRGRPEPIRFDGQVAVITGAGGGLGRDYALELARRGARVVVADFGGARDGSGGSRGPADEVVAEIAAAGGEAVACYADVSRVEGAREVIAAAREQWGRVDVVIHNAGILRDRTLLKMSDEEWEAVQRVHLWGGYWVIREALPLMKEQGYGRVVVATSAAGLFGNYGQGNYAAAKLGLVGLMNVLKLEGERYGVKVNAVAPLARTRLTEDILPGELAERLRPEFVTPLVVLLASDKCPVTGRIYNAGGGYFGRAALVAGPGTVLGEQPPSSEQVAESWPDIEKLQPAKEYHDAMAFIGEMVSVLQRGESPTAEATTGGTTVAEVFARMPAAFQSERAAGVEVVFQFDIGGSGGGQWQVEVKDGQCRVQEGKHPSPTTTITMQAEDFVALIAGRLDAMQAFTSGRLKVGGDMMKSRLIQKLFKF